MRISKLVIVILTAVLPSETACPVTLESLLQLINLSIFSIVIFLVHGIHGNQVYTCK